MMRPEYELDIECYIDYFLVKLRHKETGQTHDFPMWPGVTLDIERLTLLLSQITIVTFNGNNYDMPMLTLSLYGADNALLKKASDMIIVERMRPWLFYKYFNIQPLEYIDHVDIMEVAPGVHVGLKLYAGRCHAPQMQDLPIEPSANIAPMDRINLTMYCGNDLDVTGIMKEGLAERIQLRHALSAQYGVDLRSKSDAQIAEAVIKKRILSARPELQGYIPRRYIKHGYTFTYTPPDYIRFVTPQMQRILEIVRNANFVVTDKEEAHELGDMSDDIKTGVQIPDELKGLDIHINHGTYRIGIGGLHSQESQSIHKAIPGQCTIEDVDVTSYYPSLILSMGMFPAQLGEEFLTIYRDIYKVRLDAKAAGRKTEADGLKIVLNGTFGKLFSKYSILYAPEFGIATTITGQLALLMLIEMMELTGIQVVSANTDGIVLKIPDHLELAAHHNIKWWERTTGLGMESTQYNAIYSRDVNNYVAFTTDGKVKRKGVFTAAGLIENKNPDKTICVEAVIAFLKDGIPIPTTINACKDIRQFVVVRKVKGGGVYVPRDMVPRFLGRAVRWYYGRNGGHIIDKESTNLVAGSKGAVEVMKLPTEFPDDIDYHHYNYAAYEMLFDLGVPLRYWWHEGSNAVFATAEGESVPQGCEELSRKQYEAINK